MSTNFAKPTYEELLKIVKVQELEINRLNKKELSATNLDFYFNESLDLVCIAGTDGFFKQINPAFIKSLGYTKQELLSSPFISFVHHADVAKTNAEIDQLSKGKSSLQFENRFINKKGDIVYIQWTASVDSSKENIYAIGRDVTNIKKAQADLLESEVLLENAQKISKIGSWEYNFADHKMIWSNELYSIYELEKKNNQDLFQEFISRFSKTDVDLFLKKITQCKIDKQSFEIEGAAIVSIATTKWVHAVVYPVTDEKGIVFALRGNTQDITEQKQSSDELDTRIRTETELKLRLIEEESNRKFKNYIDNAPDGVFVVDKEGNYLEANPAAVSMTGYSRDKILTMKFGDLSGAELNENAIKEFFKLIEKGIAKKELKITTKIGEVKWCSIEAVKLLENHYVAFVKDITETKKAFDTIINNEKYFRALVENNEGIITVLDEKSKTIFRSPASQRITGYTNEEFTTISDLEYYHPDYIEYMQKNIQKTVDNPNIQVPVLFQVKHKKGNYIWLKGVLKNLVIDGSMKGMVANLQDVTESKIAQELIEQSEKRFRALVENNDGIITVVDENLKVIFRSVSSFRVTGYTDKEFDEIKYNEYFHPDYLEYIQQKRQEVLENPGKPIPFLFQVKHKKGNYIWLEGVLNNLLDDKSVNGIIVNLKDITDSKLAKDLVEEREKRFYTLIENADSIISLVDKDKNSLFRSSSSKRLTGWTDEEFDRLSEEEFFHPDSYQYIKKLKEKLLASPGELIPALFKVKCKNGNYVWLEGSLKNMFHDKNLKGLISNLRDVTESKLANELLIKERDKFAKIAATSPGLIYSMRQNKDGSLCYPYASEAIEDIYGFRYEEIESDSDKIFALIHPEDVELVIQKINTTKTELVPLKGIYRYLHPDKGLVWHEVNSLPVVEPEGTVICHGIITDITERVIADKKLNKVNRLYLFISQINQMIVRATDEQSLFREACNIAVEVGEFKMAWIGLVDENTNRVIPAMIAGEDNGYLSIIKSISKDDIPEGRGPAGNALRKEKYMVCNDIENDVQMRPWKEEALGRDFNSLISLPIKKSGNTIGLFTLYASEKNFFDDQEIALLQEATDDVSFALEVFDREIQRKKAEEAVFQSEKRYHTLTEFSPVGIFRTDASGYTTYVNPSWTQISGLSYERALGNGWLDAVHAEDRKAILNGWENATIKSEKSLSEYRLVKPDGTETWVMGQAIPEKNLDNEIIGYIGTITDITDRKNVESVIIKEKQLSETIINNLPGIFYLYDESGKFVKWNKNFERATGYNRFEIAKMKPEDLFDEGEKERITARIKSVFSNSLPGIENKLPGIEVEFYTKNKNKTPYFIDSLAIEYEGKKCVFGMGLDLTERKKAEEEFEKIHEKMEAILDAIPDLLFEVGIDGHIYNFHSRLKDFPEIYSNNVIGKTFFDILPLDAANLALSAIHESTVNGFSTGRQYSLDFPTGIRWFELSIAPMQESEEHDTHFICLSREITDAKKGDEALLKSEERYRGLLNNLDAGVVVHALDTSIIMSNQNASELLGLKVEQMLGKQSIDPEWRFLNEDGSSMVIDDFPANRIVNTKESIKNVIAGVFRPISNDTAWLLVNGYPFFDTNGNLVEIVISFIDITERKLMEIEITEGRKQAESANKAKTDFLANMSHEIRTPLNGIIGFTHLLMKSNLEKNQSEYMSTINESATSLLEIVNDILDFSKIESGKLELNIDELDLFKLTHQAIDLFKYQAEQKNIELTLHLGEDVPQFILADSVRLKQILVNLLSNALKFTNTGTIRLDIDTILNNNINSSLIKFSVKDTGIGIKGSNNAKIFQSFVQEDNSTNRKFGGTGLGLAISNQLLALMNSKLNLISKYGEGSDFFFEIEFEMLEHNNNLIPKAEELNKGEVILTLQIHGYKKVLIVEDNRINMLLAKTLVKRLISDCIIYEAKDGFEAIDQFKKEMPDIILMDIQMPNKNGYEATMEIRQLKNASEIPIIAITAGIMADDKEKCLDAGLNDYLSKPIIESDLEKMLVKWLNK
ncbi:PAS domain S-box protein [Flavobacterium degerlachei]|jgi:PAS domain S-box-containing protein|uniref:histidine kinase n=1 Tax=Flavobacterium degerlachei TaxID=229203 RepID=A0A1H2Z688_9FLAO|nr:PAS domain S-box protein [Flavobacterium degerlachei]SDX12983.1 PAS domain S-box-containing protein [Flavobacterium degerlachei]